MRRHQDFPGRASELDPAPGDLRTVQAFLNTADLQLATDLVETPRALTAWLERWGLAPAGIELTAAHRKQAAEAREALRAFLATVSSGGTLPSAAGEILDRAATAAPIRVRFGEAGELHLAPAQGGFEAALGRIFAIVATAYHQGSCRRLKICANPGCRAAFYDASSNLSGRWCTMRRCGNRLKSKTHHRRERQRRAQR